MLKKKKLQREEKCWQVTISVIEGQEAAKSSNHGIRHEAKAAITEADEGNRSFIPYRCDSDRINSIYFEAGDYTEGSIVVKSMDTDLSGVCNSISVSLSVCVLVSLLLFCF